MNTAEAKMSAEQLETLLRKYSTVDTDAALLLSSLQPLIDQAKAGALLGPLDRRDVPGSWLFNERELRRFVDLSNAYSRFKFAISDGDAPHTLRALEMIRKIRQSDH